MLKARQTPFDSTNLGEIELQLTQGCSQIRETRRLRIAMIGQRGVPATYGGIERHVEELGSRLVIRGHDVTVYVRTNYTCQQRMASYRGLQLRYLPTVPTKHLDAIIHTGLSSISSLGAKFDTIHFHGVGPGLLSLLPRALSSAAIVLTVHGLDQARGKWGWLARQVLRAGCWISTGIPHATIANARWLVDYYAKCYGCNIHYVPNGVPSEVRRSQPGLFSRRLGLRPQRYALSVARFVPEKGLDTLLYAFSRLRTEVKLVLVGDSTFSEKYADRVRQLAREDARVVVPGFVYGNDLAELFSNAALFITPSLVEGMPLTLLTAVAYGLPIVASDIPAHAEVLGPSKIGHSLVPATDMVPLAEAIEATLQDLDTARHAAEANSQRVVGHYDWADAAQQTEQIYLRALLDTR